MNNFELKDYKHWFMQDSEGEHIDVLDASKCCESTACNLKLFLINRTLVCFTMNVGQTRD